MKNYREIKDDIYGDITICVVLVLACLYFIIEITRSPAPWGLKMVMDIGLSTIAFFSINKVYIELGCKMYPSKWVVRWIQILLVRLKIIAIVSAYDGLKHLGSRIIFPAWHRHYVLAEKTRARLELFYQSEIDDIIILEEEYPGEYDVEK